MARSHLTALSRLLAASDASASFQHVVGGRGETARRGLLSPERARRVEAVLTGAREHRDTVQVRGRLIGASRRSQTFELEVFEGEADGQTLRSDIAVALREQVAAGFDTEVVAILARRVMVADTARRAPPTSWWTSPRSLRVQGGTSGTTLVSPCEGR